MIPESIKKLANKVRNEIYGRDVRESIAQSMEVTGETSNEANKRSKDTDARQTDVENRFDDQIAGNTDIDEVIDARRPEGGESYPTLRKRLDDEYKEVTTQLAQKAKQEDVYYQTVMENKQPEKMIVWIDDDAYPNVYGKVFPILKERNIPFTVAVVTERVGTSNMISDSQYKEMLESGIVEFVSHTKTHPHITELSKDELREEFRDSQRWIYENGGNPDYLVYPFGYNNKEIENIAREFYKLAITTDGGINHSPISSFSLKRRPFESPLLKEDIDKVASDGGLLVIMSHSQYPEFTTEKINDMLDYISEKDVPIVSLKTAMKHYSNIVDTTGGSIGRDGSKSGKLMGSQYESGLSLGLRGDSTLTDFPNRAKTHVYFGHSAGHGHLPADKYGVLSVERYASPDFSKSYFYPLKEKGFYSRFWDLAKNDWTEWIYQDTTEHILSTNIDNDTPLADYSMGKTVITFSANRAQAANMPYVYGGILEVIRFQNRTFSRAYFYENNNTKTHVRFVDNEGKWTDWQVYNE